MNQEQIGKFIAKCRKEKNLTQEELAELLGVTNRSISNWENGKNMPDLSLFEPLCKIFNIRVNELLSGKRITKADYQEKLEENIVNTINYSKARITKYNQVISLLFIIFGLFISLSAIMIFQSESSWSSIYSLLGIIIFLIGIQRIVNILCWYKQLLIIILVFSSSVGLLLFTDYLNVKLNHEAPMFRLKTTYIGDVTYYDNPFYDVYHCFNNEPNEYWTIEKNSNKTPEDLLNYCK